MRIVLLEFKLMRSYDLATGVKDQKTRTRRTLINGTNKGRIRFSVEHRHSERWGCSEKLRGKVSDPGRANATVTKR